MMLPVSDQAAEQFRAAQERAVGRCHTTKSYMVTATGAGGPAIDMKFLGSQFAGSRFFVQCFSAINQIIEACRRMNICLLYTSPSPRDS